MQFIIAIAKKLNYATIIANLLNKLHDHLRFTTQLKDLNASSLQLINHYLNKMISRKILLY